MTGVIQSRRLERETRLELATSTLARLIQDRSSGAIIKRFFFFARYCKNAFFSAFKMRTTAALVSTLALCGCTEKQTTVATSGALLMLVIALIVGAVYLCDQSKGPRRDKDGKVHKDDEIG
jgi:hypothetical protein